MHAQYYHAKLPTNLYSTVHLLGVHGPLLLYLPHLSPENLSGRGSDELVDVKVRHWFLFGLLPTFQFLFKKLSMGLFQREVQLW